MRIEAGSPTRQSLHRFGDREAVSGPQGTLSFRGLNKQANAVGAALLNLGVTTGERVAILSHNRLEVVPLWVGLEKRGLVRVVLHSHFDMAIHVQTLEQVQASVLVFDVRFADAVGQHRAKMKSVKHFVALGENAPDWATTYSSLTKGDDSEPRVDVDESAPCSIQLTTGTTGNPKPWTATHRSWRAVIANNIDHLDSMHPGIPAVGVDDVNLHFHALQWATGFQTLYPYLLRGARTVLLDDSSFDPAAVVDAIVRDRVTGVLVPGPMLGPILDVIEQRSGIDHALRRVVIFFATPDLLKRVSKVLGPVWCHGFGSTEQGAPTTRLTVGDVSTDERRLDSVGRSASTFFELAVVDGEGRPQSARQSGEIVVRSAMSTSEYWHMADKTKSSFFAGDWFRTGDVGYLDEDGFLFYLDRDKDKIVTSAGTVYPHVIETALLLHPAVANCGVVGIGDSGKQAIVVGVLLKAGSTKSAALGDDILSAAGATLKQHERPSRVVFVDELPTVLGGAKVQREVLQRRIGAIISQR
ncbi:MAG: class I adenylate-forming enzyme family protein [Caldimonas sp.]